MTSKFNKPDKFDPELERIAAKVVDAAYKLHKTLGPGLLESVYEAFFCHELKLRGLKVERQIQLPLTYEGMTLDAGLRLDMLVEGRLVVEIKAVEMLLNVHRVQLMTYLKLSGHELGLLINFNVAIIKDGIKRVVLSTKTS
jgi:GxxExxY protein